MENKYIISPPILLPIVPREEPQDCLLLDVTQLKDFENQFKELLKSPEARQFNTGIVYWWKTERPMPRLIGESNILYIGRCKTSLRGRYYNDKSFKNEKEFFETSYQYIIKQYGQIAIEIRESADPRYDEWCELDKYKKMHIDRPPLNRAIPSKPK